MKTVKIVLALVAAVVIFNSCTKEYAVPTIAWTPDNLSHFVDFDDETTWNKTLNITFGAEAGISEIKVWKHIYMAGETDPTSAILDGPTGYDALTTFDYEFTTTHTGADFAGGVTKIVYEFEVTDASETPQTTQKEYSFLVDEVYTVTIAVEDEQGVAITDATVTFGTVELTAAPYVFNYVPTGTYEYTVEKAGYQTVTVTDFLMAENDTTVAVEMLRNLSAYSANVLITQSVTSTYATYNGVRVEAIENTTIGVKYHTNEASTIVIKPTANCTGWVIVTDDNFTNYADIVAAYENGTPVTEYEVPFDYDSKAYGVRYFISKVDGAYLLVKYVDGFVNPSAHDGNLGNVIAFQYKN